jgi:hypothetical protein
MKKEEDIINIYWSGGHLKDNIVPEMLYPDPTTLYEDIFKTKQKDLKSLESTFFACPAIQQNFKNTFVFKNVVNTEYRYIYENQKLKTENISTTGIPIANWRHPVVSAGPQIVFALSYLFFADQSIEAYLNSPTFHKPEYTNYGTIFPGNFDIGQWFRPYTFEVQTWNTNGDFIIKENEPIFYLSFKTNKKIKIHRFNNTPILKEYARQCSSSISTIKSNTSLSYRYKIFNQSRLNETILKEIKKNIIGE